MQRSAVPATRIAATARPEATANLLRRQPWASRQIFVCRAEAQQQGQNGNSEPRNNIVSGFRGIRLSLFHPYKSLPPDGQIIPRHEEMCDPEKSRCKTHTYVYEEKCEVCSGTGHARLSHKHSLHGRSKLTLCIKCQGLGYVRCTTTQLPDDMRAKHDMSEHTMLRNFKSEVDVRVAKEAASQAAAPQPQL